jgi:glucosylceramidase
MHRLQSALDDLMVPPDHVILGSEACHCPTTGYAGGDIQIYWARAERYAHTILSDLAAGSNGWVEWNLILDSIGGPNHLNNLCDAPILAVPHRAINGSDIPATLPFEQAGHPFGPNNGDGRTREELNALGFPAKHLDAGLAVQPIYYYMGHISRYVRPGSRAVSAIVEESRESNGFRAFRAPGQVVAGGGMNDLARNGIELTAWPCEGSTRQQFTFNDKNQIQVFGHDWLGKPTVSCVNNATDASFKGITMIDCNFSSSANFEMIPANDYDALTEDDDTTKDEGLVRFKLSHAKRSKKAHSCLVLHELKNGGGAYGPRGGAQVAYGNCTGAASLWKFSKLSGEISSTYLDAGEVCMTTGWPFLQIGAFNTPNGESEKTVIILNEANDAANYVIYDCDDAIVSGSIPPRSIQTVLLGFD